jgi:hypothetical protein
MKVNKPSKEWMKMLAMPFSISSYLAHRKECNPFTDTFYAKGSDKQ